MKSILRALTILTLMFFLFTSISACGTPIGKTTDHVLSGSFATYTDEDSLYCISTPKDWDVNALSLVVNIDRSDETAIGLAHSLCIGNHYNHITSSEHSQQSTLWMSVGSSGNRTIYDIRDEALELYNRNELKLMNAEVAETYTNGEFTLISQFDGINGFADTKVIFLDTIKDGCYWHINFYINSDYYQENESDVWSMIYSFKVLRSPPKHSSQVSLTEDQEGDSLPFVQQLNEFQTQDLSKAQNEIPFPIYLPSYLPEEFRNARLPWIKGPLSRYTLPPDSEEIGRPYLVNVSYRTNSGYLYDGYIHIDIGGRNWSIPDPKTDSDYTSHLFNGVEIVQATGRWGLDGEATAMIFYFYYGDSYYRIEIQGTPYEESIKVVESIINRTD